MKQSLARTTSTYLSKQINQLGEALDVIVANGSASFDTIRNYRSQMILFLKWCARVGCNPLEANEFNIEQYRRYLINKKALKETTIAFKLTVVRRLYDAAIKLQLVTVNPASNVKPPVQRKQVGSGSNFFSKEEAQKLISYLPNENTLVALRDRLLLALMLVAGTRQIELYRLTKGNIVRKEGKVGLRLFGKRTERVVRLTPDLVDLLDRYIAAREADVKARKKAKRKTGTEFNDDSPLLISLASNHYGEALNRRTMQLIVNDYFEQADLKKTETGKKTPYACRHTAAARLTSIGKPLRVIQDFLGHADPRTTAIYAHIVNLWDDNPAIGMGFVV